MHIRFVVRIFVAAVGVLAMVSSSGCYQRTVAPQLSYDQSQIDLLNSEIKKLEWD